MGHSSSHGPSCLTPDLPRHSTAIHARSPLPTVGTALALCVSQNTNSRSPSAQRDDLSACLSRRQMMNTRRQWMILGTVVAVSFAILGYYGGEIYRQAPPIPESVVSSDGTVLFTKEDISTGQSVWQ